MIIAPDLVVVKAPEFPELFLVRSYAEFFKSFYFGLSIRQLVFSSLAVIVAVALYFLLRGRLGTESKAARAFIDCAKDYFKS